MPSAGLAHPERRTRAPGTQDSCWATAFVGLAVPHIREVAKIVGVLPQTLVVPIGSRHRQVR